MQTQSRYLQYTYEKMRTPTFTQSPYPVFKLQVIITYPAQFIGQYNCSISVTIHVSYKLPIIYIWFLVVLF